MNSQFGENKMLDPEREVEMEGDINDKPMYDHMDSDYPFTYFSPIRFPSPEPSFLSLSPRPYFDDHFSLMNVPSTSSWPPSPEPGFSERISSDGNASSSSLALVRSPSRAPKVVHLLPNTALPNLIHKMARVKNLVHDIVDIVWPYQCLHPLKRSLLQGLSSKEVHQRLRHSSLANGSDLKKSCTSFDCMSTNEVRVCVSVLEKRGEIGAGWEFSSHSPYFCGKYIVDNANSLACVHFARKNGMKSYHTICLQSNDTGDEDYVPEKFSPPTITANQALKGFLLATMKENFHKFFGKELENENINVNIINDSADDQPDSRCEFIHIPQPTKSPPRPNGLPDGEEMIQQDLLKHHLVEEMHAMNDGANVLSEGGIHSAVSYPENEETRKASEGECRKNKKPIPQEDLLNFPGSRMDAAKNFGVSVSTIKRVCRRHKITDWRSRTTDKNNQSLSKPKDRIESVQGERAEMGHQMAGRCRSREKELNHEQIGIPPESDKGSDRSQIGFGLMEESSSEMEITPAGNTFVSSTNDQCIETGDPLELPVQPIELNLSGELLIDHDISATEAFNTEQVPESSQTNRSCSDPAPKLAKATAAHMTRLDSEKQDTRTVTMKATYKGDTIKFKLSDTSGIVELRKEVADGLKLEVGTFKIKYLDDDGDWILMTKDDHLPDCFNLVSLGHKFIKLSIDDIQPS